MTSMPMHPTLLRSTQAPSKTEQTAAVVRGELGRRLYKTRHLAEILNITKYRARNLWNGKNDYTVLQIDQIALALDIDPIDLLTKAVKARPLAANYPERSH